MKQVELLSEGPVDHHMSRLMKNWVIEITPTRHNRQRLLQRAALLRASQRPSQRPSVDMRHLIFASWQALALMLLDITDQPRLLFEISAYAPVCIYRRDLDYFTTRIASQQVVNMGLGLGLFATP